MILTLPISFGSNCPPHRHEVHEIVLASNDSANLCSQGRKLRFQPGLSFLVPGGIEHHFEIIEAQHADAILICFDRIAIEKYISPTIQPLLNHVLNEGTSAAQINPAQMSENLRLAQQLITTFARKPRFHHEIAGALLNLLMLNHLSSATHHEHTPQQNRMSSIEQALTWIELNLAENITIDLAADRAQMSRAVFTKHFRKRTQMSFTEYVALQRTELAIKLLQQPHASITDVAFDCGFKNIGHFYKNFRKRFEMTPNQYRQMLIDQGKVNPVRRIQR